MDTWRTAKAPNGALFLSAAPAPPPLRPPSAAAADSLEVRRRAWMSRLKPVAVLSQGRPAVSADASVDVSDAAMSVSTAGGAPSPWYMNERPT